MRHLTIEIHDTTHAEARIGIADGLLAATRRKSGGCAGHPAERSRRSRVKSSPTRIATLGIAPATAVANCLPAAVDVPPVKALADRPGADALAGIRADARGAVHVACQPGIRARRISAICIAVAASLDKSWTGRQRTGAARAADTVRRRDNGADVKPGAVLVRCARAGQSQALTARLVAKLIQGAGRPAVQPAVGRDPDAGLEANRLERGVHEGLGQGGIQIAQATAGIAGAVGIRQALLAEALVAGDAGGQIAAEAARVVGRREPVCAVGVRSALEAVADVAAEIAEVRARIAKPIRGKIHSSAVGSSVGRRR